MPEIKQIQQDKLTGECWLVQVWGTSKCKECGLEGKDKCGGQEILKTGKNAKGHEIGEFGL